MKQHPCADGVRMLFVYSRRRRLSQRFVAGSDRHISASTAYFLDGRAVVECHISNALNILTQRDLLQATAISKHGVWQNSQRIGKGDLGQAEAIHKSLDADGL